MPKPDTLEAEMLEPPEDPSGGGFSEVANQLAHSPGGGSLGRLQERGGFKPLSLGSAPSCGILRCCT